MMTSLFLSLARGPTTRAGLRVALAWLAVVLISGCGHESVSSRAPAAPAGASSGPASTVASANTAPEMAATPYSAEQIRAANRPGTVYRYKIETSGEPAQIKVMEFTSGTSADSAEVKSQTLDESGKAKGPPSIEHTAWEELRRHAEFPRAAVSVEPGSIDVPAGKFDAMVYTFSAPNGETAKFFFAKSYAGPPVLLYKEKAGVRLMTMTLIERKSGP